MSKKRRYPKRNATFKIRKDRVVISKNPGTVGFQSARGRQDVYGPRDLPSIKVPGRLSFVLIDDHLGMTDTLCRTQNLIVAV